MRRLVAVLAVAGAIVGGSASARVQAPPPRPHVSGITADFRERDFATYYSVEVKGVPGRKVHVSWELDPPEADPGCKSFHKSATDQERAVWKHGDGDGCDHTKMTAAGHDGDVRVYVSDGAWECFALYHGTNDGTGKPATCHSNLQTEILRGIVIAQQEEEHALHDDGATFRSDLNAAEAGLDKALRELDRYGGPTAARISAKLRRAKVLDRLARELPAKKKSQLGKALELKDQAFRETIHDLA